MGKRQQLKYNIFDNNVGKNCYYTGYTHGSVEATREFNRILEEKAKEREKQRAREKADKQYRKNAIDRVFTAEEEQQIQDIITFYENYYYLNKDSRISILDQFTSSKHSYNVTSIDRLVRDTYKKEDVCVSNNTFIPPYGAKKYNSYNKARDKDLRFLNNIVIDLDYYKIPKYKDYTAEQMLDTILANTDIPTPGALIYSGHGMYLVYPLEKTIATQKTKNLYRWISKGFVRKLKEYGADAQCTDTTRVTKIIGSTNSKTGRMVQLIQYDKSIRYDLGTLYSSVIAPYGQAYINKEDNKNNKNKYTEHKSKVVSIFNLKKSVQTLCLARCHDLETLIELRNGNCEGYRELIIFLYSNFLHRSSSKLTQKDINELTLSLNTMFSKPLSYKEVLNNCKKGRYKYTNTSIINLLDIKANEQEQLRSIIWRSEEEVKERKKQKDKDYYQAHREELNARAKQRYKKKLEAQGKQTKQQQKLEQLEEVKKLLDQGLDNKQIIEKLKISRATLYRLKKQIEPT